MPPSCVERGEREERAELLREHARDQAGLAHAEGDGRLLAVLQDLERFEVVADGAGGPDDLGDVGGGVVQLRESRFVSRSGRPVKSWLLTIRPGRESRAKRSGLPHHAIAFNSRSTIRRHRAPRRSRASKSMRHPVASSHWPPSHVGRQVTMHGTGLAAIRSSTIAARHRRSWSIRSSTRSAPASAATRDVALRACRRRRRRWRRRGRSWAVAKCSRPVHRRHISAGEDVCSDPHNSRR